VNCKQYLKELTDYLDGAIDTKLRAELEEHLIWCHECYVVCNTTKMTIQVYKDNQLYELPEDLRSRLRNAVITKCKSHKAESGGEGGT